MTEPDIPNTLLRVLTEDIPRKYPVKRIWLFGSRARGDGQPRADVDLAFDAPEIGNGQWLGLVEDVENATLLKTDCIDLAEAGEEMTRNIMKDGIILYG